MAALLCLVFAINAFNPHASRFEDLPMDLLLHRVYAMLPIKDVLDGILILNNRTYTHLMTHHQFEMNIIKKVQRMIQYQSLAEIDPDKLSNLVQQVQLNELYAWKLPLLLKYVSARHKNADHILNAMNIRIMKYDQFASSIIILSNSSGNINVKLLLLVLASKSLAPLPLSETRCFRFLPMAYHPLSNTVWCRNYPWLSHPNYAQSQHKIYFLYLYQYLFDKYHQQFNIPSLDRIFYANQSSAEYATLLDLINSHGLIPWSRDVLKRMSLIERPLATYWNVMEINRIHRQVFSLVIYSDMSFNKAVLTHILLKGFNNNSAIQRVPNHHQSQFEVQQTMISVMQLAYYNLYIGNDDSFVGLIWLISKMFHSEDVDFESFLEDQTKRAMNTNMNDVL